MSGIRAALWACALAAMQAGCASRVAMTQEAEGGPMRLALPAAALGCDIAVQQHLTVRSPGGDAQEFDALLEVDAHSVRLALFHLGQRMGALAWDGRQLQAELSRWWPAQLPPEQVLSDMQLALWPLPAIEQALPAGWKIEETGSGRRLSHEGAQRVLVQADDSGAFDILYAPAAWQLRVASPGGMRPCEAERGAP